MYMNRRTLALQLWFASAESRSGRRLRSFPLRIMPGVERGRENVPRLSSAWSAVARRPLGTTGAGIHVPSSCGGRDNCSSRWVIHGRPRVAPQWCSKAGATSSSVTATLRGCCTSPVAGVLPFNTRGPLLPRGARASCAQPAWATRGTVPAGVAAPAERRSRG